MKKLSTNEIRRAWINFFEKDCGLEHKFYKSASLVPDNPTLLLNSAGMVPFIPYFIGATKRPEPPRAVSIQKCARVGGKDSDLSNIGYTQRHHSFFEMLGNFSFGNYFKQEVIPMAWKFVTEVLGLSPEKLYVSVFEGDDTRPFDEESYNLWADIFKNVYPEKEIAEHIWKLTAKDNFWGPPGPTGPCGPCSEIYYDLGEHILDKDDRYIEIWNLVFMQFEKLDDGSLKPLEHKNIDTGAGLERIAMVLQGVNNTFETDELAELVSATKAEVFKGSVMAVGETIDGNVGIEAQQQSREAYFKIIVDHLRCACFLIADGVRPSNVSRGYVLRMLIRRAARFLHKLGNSSEPLLYKLSEKAVDIYGAFYDELVLSKELIASVLRKEEELFAKTVENGLKNLDLIVRENNSVSIPTLSGAILFNLYSTYGLPLEIVEDVLDDYRKQGFSLEIDYEGYEKAREEHSKASSTSAFNVSVTSEKSLSQLLQAYPKTEFLGYSQEETEAEILMILDKDKNPISEINFSDILAKKDSDLVSEKLVSTETTNDDNSSKDYYEFFLLLNKTTLYAESGGQVSDSGYIIRNLAGKGLLGQSDLKTETENEAVQQSQIQFSDDNLKINISHNLLFKVSDVKAIDGRILHKLVIELPCDSISKDTQSVLKTGDLVKAQINSKQRLLTKFHHSSCHLLQAALRKVLGNTVSQAGSLVSAEYTRFDFNYESALSKEQLNAVEKQMNDWVKAALPVTTIETSFDEAIKLGALAFFEDKYEDTVRVLKIANELEAASVELCGGTHVSNTAEIAQVKIASESSVASGVRRIKLFVNECAERFIKEEQLKQSEIEELEKRKEIEKQLENEKKAEKLRLLNTKTDEFLKLALEKDGRTFIIADLNQIVDFTLEADVLKDFATNLKESLEGKGLLVWLFFIGAFDEKVTILGACSKSLAEIEKFKVNNLIKSAANICGGGGGGRPDFAQAGAKNIAKIPEALAMIKDTVLEGTQ
ncbi:MAG: alanine--tRNA ligase [Candidatus Melainabacteria bacterium]|nr:alanine--tRNA ligase [Candidatus Melainabacteria bacterium]